MVCHAGVEAGEGVTPTELMAEPGPAELDGELVGLDDEPAEDPFPPLEVAEAPESGESITLEPAVVAPPHPQPQRATVTSTKKSR